MLRLSRTLPPGLSLAGLLAAWFLCVPAAAGAQSLWVQAARLDGVANTATLNVEVRGSLGGGDGGLPAPGEVAEEEVGDWILTAVAGAGASFGADDEDDEGLTATAHLGLLRRTELVVDRVGLLAVGFARPLAAGPALRLESSRVAALHAGGLWFDEGRGFRWFASLEVSLALLSDVFGGGDAN